MTTVDPAAYTEGREFRLLIGGGLRASSGAASFSTTDPSTGEGFAIVPTATAADVDEAVASAAEAQAGWQAMGLEGRRTCFESLGRAISENIEDLALLDSIDSGNPISAARADVRSLLARVRDWPALALSVTGQTIDASPGNLHYTVHQPYGVVGRIVPFNHPAIFAIGKVLAPLIAGNAVVLKPAEQTPLSALEFGRLAREIFPPGVINVLSGGAEVGDALVRHPAVKRIAFTGGVQTALKIQERAAGSGIKHLSLELGGKNALIAFPDADLNAIVAGAVGGMNFVKTQGQSCGSTSRVFIHESHYDEFLRRAATAVESFRVGVAYDEGTQMGPLISEQHLAKVSDFVRSGDEEGATRITGGERPNGLDRGYFLQPTIFADVDMGMRIAREEIFGPVMSVFRWSDYDQLLSEANDVDLGLTASIWTNDLHLAHKTAANLDAGYVWINDTSSHYWGTPFGGFKNSGLGREESMDELLSYYEIKAVHTILSHPDTALNRTVGHGTVA